MPTHEQLKGLESRGLRMSGLEGLVSYVGCEIGNPNDVPQFTEQVADLVLNPQFGQQERHIAKAVKTIKNEFIRNSAGGPLQPEEDNNSYLSRISKVKFDKNQIQAFLEHRMNNVDKNV